MSVDPETGIWKMSIAKKRHKCDFILAAVIGNIFAPQTFADIGCGNGRYCAIFKAYGWPIVHGYEGTKDIKTLGVYDEIFEIDLTKDFLSIPQYDLVLCLEVAEHIPPKHEDKFIYNLMRFTKKDLILSWAIPGQYSASRHVNNKDNTYVIDRMNSEGLAYDELKTSIFRKFAQFKYFKNTVMVFGRR